MEKLKKIKAKVTSSKFDKGESLHKVIMLPEYLKSDFIKFGYGEIVKESPETNVVPEQKKRKRKTKE